MSTTLQHQAIDGCLGHRGTRTRAAALLLAAASWFIAATAHGTDISILNARHATVLHLDQREIDRSISTWDQSNTSAAPTTDTLDVSSHYSSTYPGSRFSATASADMFSVGTETHHNIPLIGHAWATAETTLTFNTLVDVAAPLDFEFLFRGQPYSRGFISLFDQTTSRSLFDYAYCWAGPCERGNDTVPWVFGGTPGYTATAYLSLSPWLESDHSYSLTLHGATYANGDDQWLSINVSGLSPVTAPVPEPSTYALMLVGLSAVGLMARRRRQAAPRL